MSNEVRCAIYARYSSDMQRDSSIEDQIRKCRDYAQKQNWKIVESYVFADRAISGANIKDRKDLQGLLDAAKSRTKPFTRVLIDDTSRLARDLPTALKTTETLQFHGVQVTFVSQGIDTQDQTARQMMTVHGMMDEQFIKSLGDKVHRGLHGKVLQGLASGGRCYGYRNVAIEDPTRLGKYNRPIVTGVRMDVDPEQAIVVRRIFDLYASGNSLATIVKTLNSEEVPPPRATSNRHGSTWCVSSVYEMLRNERYIGVLVWNRTKKQRNPETGRKISRTRSNEDAVRVEVPTMRIVTDEQWQAARQRGANMRKQFGSHTGLTRAAHSKYLFSGLLQCGDCGANMSIVSGCGKRGYAKYGCPNHRHRGTCSNSIMVRYERLEAQLLSGIEERLLKPNVIDDAVKDVEVQIKEYLDNRTGKSQVSDSRQSLQAQADRVTDAIATIGHNQLLIAKLKEIQQQLDDFDRQAQAPPAKPNVTVKQVRDFVTRELMNVPELLRCDPARTKAFLAEHLGKISLTAGCIGEEPVWNVKGEWNLLPTTADAFAMVARDGIEPPTPAFSGLRSTS
jgi:site-specific DNA recombinase